MRIEAASRIAPYAYYMYLVEKLISENVLNEVRGYGSSANDGPHENYVAQWWTASHNRTREKALSNVVSFRVCDPLLEAELGKSETTQLIGFRGGSE